MNPWLAMLLVAGTLGALMVGLRLLQTRLEPPPPHPEVMRKLLHVSMGLVTLNLPWLFEKNWPVVSLAAVTMVALFLLKRSKLKGNVGQVLHGVARASEGDLYFPLAVATVFVLADGNTLLFCLPILILTIADATAALIGLRYGLSRYQTAEGEKSFEGSVAFFTVTFISVLVSLLLFTQVDRVESVLIAFMLGLLVMMLEAVAWRGLDNLFIPLAGYLLLSNYVTMARSELLLNLGVVAVLLTFVSVWRKRTAMDPGAVITAALAGYLIWATGGWRFMVAPLILFLSYTALLSQEQRSGAEGAKFSVYAVLSATVPGLLWLLVANGLAAPWLLYPYTLFFALYLSIVGMTRMLYVVRADSLEPATGTLAAVSTANNRGGARLGLPSTNAPLSGRGAEWNRKVAWQSVTFGWVTVFIPYLIFQGLTLKTLALIGTALLLISVTAYVFYLVQPKIRYTPHDTQRWVWQSVVAGAASVFGLVPLFFL